MACMAAIASVGTTVGTGVIGAGALTFVIAGAQVNAAEYTDPEDLTAITFANGDVLNLSNGAKVEQSLTMDADTSSITLNVTGGTVEWAAAQAENYGASVVNIATGATLNVTSGESQLCVFSSKAGGTVVINMEAGAKMVSNNLFGWENQPRGDSARTVNMGAGAKWTINAGTNFYLNRTTLNLSGGEIVLNGENTYMWFERRQNSINTTAGATQMSIISGAGAIKAGNNGNEDGGYTFNVVRGAFSIDNTNTADLLLSARLINADAAHGVQKTGDGVMQITSDSTGFTHSFFVRAGEVKFTGSGNLGSGGLQVLSGATLTLNTNTAFAGGIQLQEGGTLNLTAGQKLTGNNNLMGTVCMTGAVTLTGGTVTLGENTVIDLSGWTGGSTYQLFNLDGGTVAAGKVAVSGVEGEGTWVLDDTGLLELKNSVVWSSGTAFTWKEGTLFDENVAFSDGMLVEIGGGLGNVTATLTEDLTVPELTVKEGTNFIMTGEGSVSLGGVVLEGVSGITFDFASETEIVTGAVTATDDAVIAVGANGDILWEKATFKGGSPSLLVEGKMTLKNSNAFNDAAQITVDGGELVIDYANFNSIWKGDLLIDNGGKVSVITNGADLFNWGDANKIEILNGSTLDVGPSRASVQNVDEIILQDGHIIGTGDQHGALDFFDNNSVVSSSGTSSILAPIRLRSDGNTTEFKVTDGTLTLSETCDKGGGAAGSLKKTGAGTLVVTGGLAHRGTNTISEGTLRMEGGNVVGKTILDGGALEIASAVDCGLGELTGTGAVTVKSVSTAASIATITDLSGTITVEEGAALTLNAVNLAAGKDVTVTGTAIAGSAFEKTGEGQLTLDVLNVAGNFAMNGVQGLSIATLNLQSGAQLVYGAGDVISIGSVTSSVALNVYGVVDSLTEGFNTGITLAEGQSLADLKSLLQVDAVDSFTIFEKDGMVWLSSTAAVESDWDINWGSELGSAPNSLTTVGQDVLVTKKTGDRPAYDCIDGVDYVQDGVVALSVNAEKGANELYVTGGAVGNVNGELQSVTVDAAWIEVTGGSYNAIVGGSVGNSWGGSGFADFTGDSHILMRAGTTDYVIGGNMNDGNTASVFNGDTYVSVYDGATVSKAVVGGSTTAHSRGATVNGNTNVFVYTCMPDSTYVVGGNFQISGEKNDVNVVNGNTNVLVDLSSYTGSSTDFMAAVVGGGLTYLETGTWWTGSSMMNINGDTNVNIVGKEGITFTRRIVGGTYTRHFGTAASKTPTPGGAISGSTNINISGGSTFAGPVITGSYLALNENKTNTSTIGSSNLTISGGTFNEKVLGGSWHDREAAVSTVGDVTISISGDASFKSYLMGGSYVATGGNTTTVGDVTIDLQGGEFADYISGGHIVRGAGSALLDAKVGDISLTVDGATTADVYGGSVIDRNKADATVAHGNISIELTSGTIGGDVYAGGWQNGSTLLTAESTTVTVSKDVVLTEGKTVSGGFKFADGKTGSTVTGAAKLVFADAVTYSNVTGVNFADFNTVEVVEGGSVSTAKFTAMGASLTKDGAGAFNVTDHAVALDTLTMNGGTFNAAFGLTTTDGLTANITAPSKVTLGKDLTLAALDIDLTGATAGQSIISVAGELSSNGMVNVNLTGIESLAVGGEYILVAAGETSLTTDMLNATLDATAPEGVQYVVEVAGTNIVFRSAYVSDWVWEGSTDGEGTVWSADADGWKADGEGSSPNGKKVYFSAEAQGVVTISGEVAPSAINISSGEYTFEADAENGGSIALGTDGELNISAGATLNLALDNEDLGGTTDLKGTLVLQSAGALGDSELEFNGGTLVYDTLEEGDTKTHISTDLSKQASLAVGYDGLVKIEVTDAENSVKWDATGGALAANTGVSAVLTAGIEKTGDGKLNVDWSSSDGDTYIGAISVKEGKLSYHDFQQHQITFTGAIDVAEGAHVSFLSNRYDSDEGIFLTGNITGSGVVEVGSTDSDDCRYRLSGDNSAFTGTIRLSGCGTHENRNLASFANDKAFGGAGTTVEVNGRGFFFLDNGAPIEAASDVVVLGASKGNVLSGSMGQEIFFTGAWTVAEDAAFGATIQGPVATITAYLAGDISEFKGTLRIVSKNTWVLGGEGITGSGTVDMAEITGKGKLTVQYGTETVLNSVVSDDVDVRQSGAGKLILAAENTSKGTLTVDAGKEVQLGSADIAAAWAGSELAGEGTMTLVNGMLSGLTAKDDTAKLVVETTTATVTTFAGGAATGTVVDLTGSDATLVDSIKLVEGSTLIVDDALTVGGEGATTLDMSFTTDNIGATADGLTAMIQGGDLTISGTEGVNFNMTNADVLTALNNIGEGDLYLQVTDGKLGTAAGVDINDVIAPDLLGLGVRAQLTDEGKEGGYVLINGDVSGVYFTNNQEGCSEDTEDTVTIDDSRLEVFSAVVINEGDTLEVSTDTTINNLNGQEGGDLSVTDGASVVLNNEQLATGVQGYDPMGANNKLEGNLTGEEGTTITMQGKGGSLTVDGAVDVDTFTVTSGALTVGESLTAEELNITGGSVTADGGATVTTLAIAEGATMEVGTGEALDVVDATVDGELSGSSSELSTNGLVTVGENGSISGFDLSMADGSELAVGGMVDVSSLTAGAGATLSGTGGTVDVAESGSFAGTLSGSGALTTAAGSSFTFDNATGAAGWDVTNKGDMTIDLTESGNLTLGALTLADGSTTNMLFNSDNGTDELLTLKGLNVADGAEITLSSTGAGQLATGEYTIGTVDGEYTGADELYVNFSGTAFSQLDKLNSYVYVDDNGNIVLNAVKAPTNTLAEVATETNSETGAELLWNATAPVGGELEAAYNAVNDLIAAGAAEEANELMASVAGASNAALGMAFAGDVSRQLRAIRNRTTTMGVNQCVVNEGMPYVNAWVNVEGDRKELDTDSLASGYTLDSWGGTVGVDIDVNPQLTIGFALTAMYGNFTTDGPDVAEGDMDTYYVSAFARACSGAWTHTFVATIGRMDGSIERTVNYGAGAYTTEASVDGMGFGLMYEVGRVYALDEDGDTCLQPIFNIAYRHAGVGSFDEENSDAALSVESQSVDTVTLGLGARLQTVVGENTFNRTSILELRAMAKLDVGDTTSDAEVSLINGTGHGRIESAELGAFGGEVGLGLHIPVGDENDGTIFVDFSAEFRSGYTNVNGVLGYRINF